MDDFTPRWHRELEIFMRVKPIILLEGNVLDIFQYPVDGGVAKGTFLRLTEYLHYFFLDHGYGNVVMYDHLQGFQNPSDPQQTDRFAALVQDTAVNHRLAAPFKGRGMKAAELVQRALRGSTEAVAVVMDFASRYITASDRLDQTEVDAYTQLQLAGMESRDIRTGQGMVKNLCVLLVNKLNDLPPWFYLQYPNCKAITVSTPTREERAHFVKGDHFSTFFARNVWEKEEAFCREHPDDIARLQERFVALTEGMSFIELNGLRKLCKNERYAVADFCDVIDLFKFGIRENPWKKLGEAGFADGKVSLEKRVKGQDAAVEKVLDVLTRAMTGLSGLQHSSNMKPKGVMFFAGPTGTGKTEMAKTMAERVFGDESACVRFDMSEFSQSHSDQRLLGAPPGYVGYEAGGQLTNAVRARPFSILLFDEIEKAHPTVLDKFLQILEDGRMTDGQGNTVYFSECIIIFTSNLGIYTLDPQGRRVANVTPDMPYEEVRQQVRGAVERYFKLELGRPEILNRIGENIVVFDFIRPDTAAAILTAQLNKIADNLLSEHRIVLTISDAAYRFLLQKSLGNLENGGRGIGNVVESCLINPLARYLFEHQDAKRITVSGIEEQDGLYRLVTEGNAAASK